MEEVEIENDLSQNFIVSKTFLGGKIAFYFFHKIDALPQLYWKSKRLLASWGELL